MPDRDLMVKLINEYCRAETEQDKEAWLALFADNAKHEDPVGVRTNVGLKNLSAFWDSFQSAHVELWLTEPAIVCGNEAIALMRCRTGPSDSRIESGTIVDQFIFDDDGRITNLRAFYDFG